MRDKSYLNAKKEAKEYLDEMVENTPEVPKLIKLYKAGFDRALERLIEFMKDDMNPFRDDAAIAVYQLIKEESRSMADVMGKLRNKSGGKGNERKEEQKDEEEDA
jgi:hypothetical protein